MDINKKSFQLIFESLGYKVEPEFRFNKERKFRADWLLENPFNGKETAVEYEGIFCGKSRHTNVKGFSTDCEKYNLMQISGYPVLRYTAKNFNNVISDVESLIGKP